MVWGQRSKEKLRSMESSFSEMKGLYLVAEENEKKWRARAERVLGALKEMQQERDRLLDDNRRLSEKLVELAMKPAEREDIRGILEEFRKTFAPDIVVNQRPDRGDEQRAGIVWADQGLDNTGGTPENVRGPFDETNPMGIPDYVLEVEGVNPDEVKGTRGGWFNPQQNPLQQPAPR